MSSGVGIFGGTSDPPHRGHLAAAERARAALGLDRVLFVVANDPWQKSPGRTVSPAAMRVQLVRDSIADNPGFEVCSLEIERGGPSYTIDTVSELSESEGINDPWVIVGSDLAATLDTWERADELKNLVRIAVLSRPGSPLALPSGWRSVALESDELDISSSQIREMVAKGQGIGELVPESAVHDIGALGLYA
jgi:nicotinate-nucleotide adenylyltransferase